MQELHEDIWRVISQTGEAHGVAVMTLPDQNSATHWPSVPGAGLQYLTA